MSSNRTRREFAKGMAAIGGVGALAGCTGGGNGDGDAGTDPVERDGNTVIVGPGGQNVFDPEELTISVGDTVTWEFDSAGHNVSALPEHADEVELPDGAEPFASIDGDNQFETNAVGESFEHTFDEPGTYQYVCTPHIAMGMIARIIVEA